MKAQSSWWQPFIAPFTLAGITAFVYSFSLRYNFQFDDIANIRTHFYIRHEKFWELAFGAPRWISYWLNTRHYQLGGFDPFYYRSFNVFIHITTGLLIFYILKNALSRLDKDHYCRQRALAISYLTALLFLLHPVQTQTVSYVIQGQLEGLAGLFVMSLILIFLRLTETSWPVKKYGLIVLLFGIGYLSCGTKEIAILSPMMLLLIDWFFVAQGDWQNLKQRLPLHLLFFCLIGSTYLYYLKPQFFKSVFAGTIQLPNNVGNVITAQPQDHITPWNFFISEFKVIVHYISIFLWPFNMSVDYDWKMVQGFFTMDCLGPLTFLIILLGIIVWRLRRNRTDIFAFGALWFFIGLIPRSTVIPSTELLADYKTYFSSFGGLLLLGILLIKFFEWAKEQIARTNCPSLVHHPYTAFCLCALLLGTATYRRNLVWSSEEAFWEDILQHSPLKARAHNNYGTAVALQGNHDKAVQAFKKAVKLDPFYPDPWNNLAVTYEKQGKVDRAIETMERALKMHQDYPEFHNNLGSFMLSKQEYDKVEEHCRVALKLRPHYGKAFYNIARAKFEQGKMEESWQLFHDAIYKADFDTIQGYDGLAQASMKLEKFDDAIMAFEKVLSANPHDPTVLFNLGNAYYCKGNLERAETLYLAMIEINPQDPRGWYNLGELYLKTKDAQSALPFFEKASPLKYELPKVGMRIAECRDWAEKEARGESVVIS